MLITVIHKQKTMVDPKPQPDKDDGSIQSTSSLESVEEAVGLELDEWLAELGVELDGDYVIVNGKRMTLIEWLFSDNTEETKEEKH